MHHELLKSSECAEPEIDIELVRDAAPVQGWPSHVVALSLVCEFMGTEKCPLSNRLVGRGNSKNNALIDGMQSVNHEVARGCKLKNELNASS